MKSGVPWQVKVRPEARETAREAARRAGLSLEEWLDTVIIDSAANAGIGPVAPEGEQPRVAEYPDWSRFGGAQPEKYPDYDDLRGPPARDEHQIAAVPDDPYAPVAGDEHGRPSAERGIVGVHHRLDNLTRQIDQLARLNSANAERAATEQHFTPSELNELISRLDHRLDKLSDDGRSAANEIERRMSAVDRAVADLGRDRFRPAEIADSPTSLDQALSEIADRQRALDDDDLPASARAQPQPESLPRARTQDLSGLERELRHINTQIEAISRPCGVEAVIGKAVETLRDDLAEIGVMLQEAMPRKAVEALESEVRRLADRIEHGRQNGTDGAAITGVERGLAEVRDALQALTPAENLVGFDNAIQELARKVDLIGAGSQDPAALKELEGTIVAMRGIVSHVASNDALAKLSDEVRLLAEKVDHAAGGGGSEVLSSLERRIASLADALEARNRHSQDVPHELESVLAGLADKIERGQLSRGDQMALGHLEDRIAKLVEKLDASDARLNHLETIERGLAELLIHLEHQRVAQPAVGAPPEIDTLNRDVADLRQNERKTQDSLEAVHGTLGDVVDRLAMIETDMRGRSVLASAHLAVPGPALAPPQPTMSQAMSDEAVAPALSEPRALRPAASVAEATEPAAGSPKPAPAAAAERRPIDPNLPPDHPLEPGSGATRGRQPSSPAERIAASEAALGPAKPPVIPDPAGKSNFIAAARRAAQAAGGDATARNTARPTEPPRRNKTSIASLLRRHSRSLIVGASVAAIVLGSLHMAMTWFGTFEDHAPAPASSEQAAPAPAGQQRAPDPTPAREPPAATTPAKSPAGRRSSLPSGNDRATVTAPVPDVQLAMETARQVMGGQGANQGANQGTNAPGLAPAPEREITGTVSQPVAKPATGTPAPAAITPAAPVPTASAKALSMHTTPAATSLAPATQAPSTGVVPTISTDALPAGIGHALRTAAARGDPAACFEIGQRYAEGRGLPQDFAEATVWFERAAKQGLAPAHFRLGGLHEKGLGVKKNLDAARKHYLVAGEAGNGKALHNLAVLHAEGIDGKPDYPTAAKWFRKAAEYGVADSQYNLGVLYARGIGVEQNLTEAYKWFALAAREGDRESTKKRDDIAGRLDERSLKIANAAAEAWAPARQPEAAVQVKTPPGGWDSAAAPAVPAAAPAVPAPAPAAPAQPAAKRKPVAAAPKLDWSIPRLAQ